VGFIDRVRAEARLAGDTEASFAVSAVARVLRAHVSEGELTDVMAVLPEPIRTLFADRPDTTLPARPSAG
jgi:uncharacterized protein (DUF2267 family)